MALPKGIVPLGTSTKSESPSNGLPPGMVPVGTAKPKAPPPETDTLAYVMDQIKSEVGQQILGVIPDFLQKKATGGAVDPMEEMRNSAKIGADGKLEGFDYSVRDAQQAEQDRGNVIAERVAGYEGLQPASELDRYLGIGARAIADPTTIVGMGGKTVTGKLASAGMEYLYSAAAMGGGAAGGEMAREVADNLGFSEKTQDIAAEVTAALTGGALNAGRTIAETGFRGARNAITNAPKKLDEMSDFLSSSEVRNVIGRAAETDSGNLQAKLKMAQELQDTFPGLVLPTAVVGKGNPIIDKNFRELYATYPDFRARYDKVESAALARLQEETAKLGATRDIKQKQIQDAVKGYSVEEITKAEKDFRKQSRVLEDRLDIIAAKLENKTDEAAIGRAADSIMEARREAAAKVANKYYDKALKPAQREGVTMSPESVATVYKTIKDMKLEDVFATFPGLAGKVEAVWGPKSTEVFDGGLMLGKAPTRKVLQFQAAPVKDVDSLKRALNKAMRTTNDQTQLRQLGSLKDVLYQEIGKMPADFVQKYREADGKFAELLGVPNSKEGIKSLDRARFETMVGNQLGRYDQARDYLSVVGEEGAPVVRDALILKANRSGVLKPSGEVDLNQLARFIRRNEATLDLVPGLKKELSDARNVGDAIATSIEKLNSDFNSKSLEYSEGFYKAIHQKNLEAVASEILSKPNKRAMYLDQIAKMPPAVGKMAKKGLEQAVMHKAIEHKGTMYDYIQKNEQAFRDVFGPEYMKNLKTLSNGMDFLAAIESNKVGVGTSYREQDSIGKATGVNSEQVIGTFRNQVMSTWRKMFHIGSKVFLHKSAVKRDKKVMDVMIDTRAIKAMADAVSRAEQDVAMGRSIVDSMKANGKTLLHDLGIRVAGRLAKGAYQGSEGLSELADQMETEDALQVKQGL